MCKEKKTAVFLAAMCFASYAVSYIGRMNYSAALPGMLAEGALSKKQGGVISAAYFASYGAGQLLNGFLADRGNPKIQVSAGLAGSALFNLLMYFTDSASLMPVIWGLNGYAQSLIWAPAFLMVSRYTGSRYRAEALLLLNTAPSVGTMLAYGFSWLVLRLGNWRVLFLCAALALVLILGVWLLGCGAVFRAPAAPWEAAGDGASGNGKGRRPEAFKRWGLPAVSAAALLILPSMAGGMLKDGVTSWFPAYMAEEFAMPAEAAMRYSLLLPLVNMFGAAVGCRLVRRVQNEAASAGLLFFCAALCAGLLSLAGKRSPAASAFLFALITAAMMGASVILTSEVPSRFAGLGIAASVSGFFNACGYAGTAVSTYGIAWIAGDCGWGAARGMWIAAAVLAMGFAAAAVLPWNRFLKSREAICLGRDQA